MTPQAVIAAICGAGALAAVIYSAALTYRPVSLPRSVVKTVATGALALAAVLAMAPVILVAALSLGALGDWFLSRPGQRAFLAGLSAFALAHVAYTVLLAQGLGAAVGPAHLVLFAVSAGMAMLLFRAAGPLRWPVMGYVVILTVMAWAALGLPEGRGLARWAAILFVASDTILAFELFLLRQGHPARRITPPLLWALYWTAQALFLAALSPVRFT